MTDSARDRLFSVVVEVDGAPGDVAVLPLGGDWAPVEDDPPGTFAANGIRTLADGTLILVDSRDGGLYQVLRRNGTAVEIPVSGAKDLLSGDGLVIEGDTLYVVRGRAINRVQILSLAESAGAWSATWQRSVGDPDLSVPSTATLEAGSLWAVNAEFGTGDNTYEVVRVDLG